MEPSAEQWQRVKDAFLAATDLEGRERESWLEELRARSPELWQEVSSLLEAHAQPEAIVDRGAAEYVSLEPREAGDDRWVGRRLGAYVVVSLLGRGGMGDVYRARRADEQYQKEVAIKVVRAGFDTGYVLERFRAERQILADLDHPNIARLLDGGVTPDGLPYLVMELIDGQPIDRYCDRERLGVRERLKLFLPICEAVQFAHQRLVIHRDLKTSNLLVTAAGTPKLLDFGVARLLKQPGSATEQTLLNPLTPAYASPEQLRGEPLTTATDVYSLGVVLYELLTGSSPFRPRPGQPDEALAARVPPRRPSTALERDRQLPVSASRASTPHRLRRQLAGDLDAIVMKALRSEPELRYGSVQQFADDIERHLLGAPVTAHRGSWRYRATKFVQRNTIAVAAALVTVAALSTGLVVSLQQAQIARAQRARADARFEDVRRLSNALIFDVNGAMADTPGNTAARKLLLDRAVAYLDKLSQDAAGDSGLQRELAWGYRKLAAVQGNTTESNVGEISAADASLAKANALFEAVYQANPGSVEDGLNVARSHRLIGASDIYYEHGWPEISKAVAIVDQLARRHPDDAQVALERARTYDLLGSAQDIRGERLKSVASIREALAAAQALQRRDPKLPGIALLVAGTMTHLGDQLSRVGALDDADRTLSAAVQTYATLPPSGDALQRVRNAAHAQGLLGRVRLQRGRVADAEALYREAEATDSGLLKKDPANSMLAWDVASMSFERGRLLIVTSRLAAAQAAFGPVLERYAQAPEDDSGPGAGVLHAWLAQARARSGQYEDALKELEQSVTGLKAEPSYADARTGLAADQVALGDVRLRRREFDAARSAYEAVLSSALGKDAVARGDVSALYAIAGAQSGMGDLLMAQARDIRDPALRAQAVARSCGSYADSRVTWNLITQPGLFSPDQYPSTDRESLAARLAACGSAAGGARPPH